MLHLQAPSIARENGLNRRLDAVKDDVKQRLRWGLVHGVPRLVVRSKRNRDDIQSRLIAASATHDDDALFALYDEVYAGGSFTRGKFTYLTAHHDVVRDVLASNDVQVGAPEFSGRGSGLARWASTPTIHPLQKPSLLATNPPDHTRYRKLVTRVFTVRAVDELREVVEKRANALLDELLAQEGTIDLAQTYCAHLPVVIISEILGVPSDEYEEVLRLGGGIAPSLDFGQSWGTFRSVEQHLFEFEAWLDRHIERLRHNPGDDLLSQLVHARDEDGTLNERELKSTAGLVLAAGFETTVNLLGNAVALLDANPEQLAAVKADPSLWSNVVEETLRYDPPVLLTGRMVSKNTEIHGQELPAGALVITMLGAAGRDPEVFDNPNQFDVTRENAKEHIAFSGGRHFCLGAALARMEGEVGLRVLYERCPDLKVVGQGQRRPTRILRGWEHLPVQL